VVKYLLNNPVNIQLYTWEALKSKINQARLVDKYCLATRIGRIIQNNKSLISDGATNKHSVGYPAKFLSMEVKANLGKPPKAWKLPKFRAPGLIECGTHLQEKVLN